MRYVGQEHAVTVDLPLSYFEKADRDGIKKHFDELHAVRYGTNAPLEPAELVSLRVTVSGVMLKPPRERIAGGDERPAAAALRGHKQVYFRAAGGRVQTPVYVRTELRAGNRISGPALIEEHASTTVLAPNDALVVDDFGNLDIAIGSDRT
jgi:N-methylhydantoinase A